MLQEELEQILEGSGHLRTLAFLYASKADMFNVTIQHEHFEDGMETLAHVSVSLDTNV